MQRRRRSRRRAATILTLLAAAWLAALAVAEFVIGEHDGITTLITFAPQHLFAIPLVVALLAALALRAWRQVLVNLILLGVFLFVFMGLHLHRNHAAGKPALRVMTYNIHGSTGGAKNLLAVVEREKPDVLAIEETGAVRRKDDLLPLLAARGWNLIGAGDVAIASKLPLRAVDEFGLLQRSSRRALHGELTWRGQTYNIVAVHLSTNMQPRNSYPEGMGMSRLLQMRALAEEAPRERTIVLGDFNTPPRGHAYREMSHLFTDAFKAGSGFGYTFSSSLPLIRIDHVFLSRDLKPVSWRALEGQESDHRAVVVEVAP